MIGVLPREVPIWVTGLVFVGIFGVILRCIFKQARETIPEGRA